MPFTFKPTSLPEVILIEVKAFPDERGSFAEQYKASEFKASGIPYDFVQDNFSISKQNVIRGLHYQLHPQAQGKLVSAVFGSIFDVAVDIRKDSSTFGKWVGVELSDKNNYMLFIPPGFAHGFAVLSEEARVSYKTTSEYSSALDRGIRFDDPALHISWEVLGPIVSEKDKQLPLFDDAEVF